MSVQDRANRGNAIARYGRRWPVATRQFAALWLRLGLKAHGLAIAPELATGDGALGFRKAPEEVSPATRHPDQQGVCFFVAMRCTLRAHPQRDWMLP